MAFLNELFSAGVWGEKTPAAPKWKKWIHRNLSDNHCLECLMLDGCWFLKEKTPKHVCLHDRINRPVHSLEKDEVITLPDGPG